MNAFNPLKDFFTAWSAEGSNNAVMDHFSHDLGERAIVSDMIEPYKAGRVSFQGSWWPAQSVLGITIEPGEVVQVIGRQSITLLVKPIRYASSGFPC